MDNFLSIFLVRMLGVMDFKCYKLIEGGYLQYLSKYNIADHIAIEHF